MKRKQAQYTPSTLWVKRNYTLRLAIGIMLLLVGLLFTWLQTSKIEDTLSGLVISVSIALNIWTLFQTGQKMALTIQSPTLSPDLDKNRSDVAGELAIVIGKTTIPTAQLVKISTVTRGYAVVLHRRGNPLLTLQIRSEEQDYPRLLQVIGDVARRANIPMEQ